MTPHDQIQRANEATQVLTSRAYTDAMAAMKKSIFEGFKACSVRDKEGLTLLHQMATLADSFESSLSGMVASGKVAQHRLDLDAARDEPRIKQFFRRQA